jgi:alpha-1,2-glucosyltransferase
MAPGVLHPTTWVPYLPWIGVAHIIKDAQAPLFKGPYKSLVAFVSLALYAIASIWQNQVTRIVPEPYLVRARSPSHIFKANPEQDEIFHIPQAQAYCVGDFHIWDPKLTTPPGLYAFATIFGNLGGIRNCDVFTLRLFNTLVLVLTMSYASSCRGLINRLSNASALKISPDTLHTAFNIALFPPLFFFSGLFYTDVLSTCLVLRMYKLFLQRERGVWLYVAGILALTMRQTNIFWVAVYMGGLEVVRTLQDIQPSPLKETSEPKTWKETVISTFRRYARGEIHDIPLQDAEIHGSSPTVPCTKHN